LDRANLTPASPRRVLITGASGLLGLNLALELAPHFQVFGQVHTHRLKVVSKAAGVIGLGEAVFDQGRFRVVETDLLDAGCLERMLDETRPDWIIHCAALANLDACEADPRQAEAINADLPGKLAAWVHARRGTGEQLPRLLHVSTDAVFDGERGNYTEEDVPNPLSVYARTKLAGEARVLDADPEAIVARVNLFGWSLLGRRSLAELFFYTLQSGKPMMGFVDVIFCPLLVNDLAAIFSGMLKRQLRGIYHVVSSESLSKYAFGLAIAEKFGFDPALVIPTRVADAGLKAARAPNLNLRSDKLASALGAPLPRISPAIHRFWELYQQGYPQKLRALLDDAAH